MIPTDIKPQYLYFEPSKRPINVLSTVEHIQAVKKRATTETVLKEFASHMTYYKSYKSLSIREKTQREDKLAKEVLCALVDNKDLKENGIDYLHENGEEIASLASYFLDMVKAKISKWVKCNVHKKCDEVLEESNIQPDLIEEDVIDDVEATIKQVQKLQPDNYHNIMVESVGQEIASNIQEKTFESSLESNQVSNFLEGIHTFSKSLLLGSSQSFFNQQRELFCETFKVNKQYFPSVYTLTKERPQMDYGIISLKNQFKVLDEEEKKNKQKKEDKALKAAKKKKGETDADRKSKIQKLYYSKIDSNYPNIIKEHLIGKVERKFGKNFFNDVKKIGVLNSYNGARHLLSMDGDINVISYSSALFCKELYQKKYKPTQSANILTHQQVISDEKASVVLSSIDNLYKEVTKVEKNLSLTHKNACIDVYDIYDVKMIELLLQCSKNTRTYYPFPLCKCKRGEALKNINTFKCKMFSDEEYARLVSVSENHWRKEYSQGRKSNDIEKFRDWADKDNYGVTHFGINKDNIKISKIRFDLLHLKLSITRKLIKYIRRLLSRYSFEIQQKYIDDVLSKDDNWGEFYIKAYEGYRNVNVLRG